MSDRGTVGQSARTGVVAGGGVKPAALGGLTGGVPRGVVGRSSGLGRATLGAGGLVTLTPVTETDTAGSLSFAKQLALTPAVETDSAQGFILQFIKTLGVANETDVAPGLVYAAPGSGGGGVGMAPQYIRKFVGVKQADIEGAQSSKGGS